jgi:hypothetical protein
MDCPHCHSTRVRPSFRGGRTLVWPLRFLMVCLRCHDCCARFYRLKWVCRAAAARPAPKAAPAAILKMRPAPMAPVVLRRAA